MAARLILLMLVSFMCVRLNSQEAGSEELFPTTTDLNPVKDETSKEENLSSLSGIITETVPEHYTLLLVGDDVREGKYQAVARDGKIQLAEVPNSDEDSSLTTPTPTVDYLATNSKDIFTSYKQSLLEIKTELNLRTLKNILPKMEVIQKQMSLLLQKPNSNPGIYSNVSDALEEKAEWMEDQIMKVNAVVRNFSLARLVLQGLNGVQQEITQVLDNHHRILSEELYQRRLRTTMPPTTTKSPLEIVYTTLDDTFPSPLNENLANKVMGYMNQFSGSVSPSASYGYLFRKIQSQSDPEDYLTVRAAAAAAYELQKYPSSFSTLMTRLPAIVTNLLSPDYKCIKWREYNRYLKVDPSGVKTVDNCVLSYWKIQPVENFKYFQIATTTVAGGDRLCIGVGTGQLHAGNANYLDVSSCDLSVTNNAFHWKVVLVKVSGSYYLRFVNVRSQRALDANSGGLAYVYADYNGAPQHWLMLV